MASNSFGSISAIHDMSYHHLNCYSNNDAIMILDNEICWDYAHHTCFAFNVNILDSPVFQYLPLGKF